MELIDCSCCEF